MLGCGATAVTFHRNGSVMPLAPNKKQTSYEWERPLKWIQEAVTMLNVETRPQHRAPNIGLAMLNVETRPQHRAPTPTSGSLVDLNNSQEM